MNKILRYFDDLGRIYIPKEIRQKLNIDINKDEQFEVFVNDNAEIVIRRPRELVEGKDE